MKKAVERLRQFCSHLPHPQGEEGMAIADEFEKWQKAMFSAEDLNDMARAMNEKMEELCETVKYNMAIKDVLDFASKRIGMESPYELNEEALSNVKQAITQLEEKLDKVNEMRTLIDMEGMLYQ